MRPQGRQTLTEVKGNTVLGLSHLDSGSPPTIKNDEGSANTAAYSGERKDDRFACCCLVYQAPSHVWLHLLTAF